MHKTSDGSLCTACGVLIDSSDDISSLHSGRYDADEQLNFARGLRYRKAVFANQISVGQEFSHEGVVDEPGFRLALIVAEQRLPQQRYVDEQEFAIKCDVDGQGFPCASMMVEQGLPSSPTVVEPRFSREKQVYQKYLATACDLY